MNKTINMATVGLTDKERIDLWDRLARDYGTADARATLLTFAARLEQEVIDRMNSLER